MFSTLWAPYGDAIKLILTGSTSQTLTPEQKAIYLSMLDQGIVDEQGNRKEKRALPGISTCQYVTNTETGEKDTYYYIPDVFRFMLTVFKKWSVFNPPVDLDYLNSLRDESGKTLFMFSEAPGYKEWAQSKEGQLHWDLICKKMEIEDGITELQKTHHGNDPLKLEAQKRMMKSFSVELNEVNQQLQKYDPPRKRRATSGQPPNYIAFPKAYEMLHTRLNANPEEIAMWVWLGRNNGGLNAYRNVSTDYPEEFYFDHLQGEDYMVPLMGCYFFQEDIISFTPAERYMSGKALVERWTGKPGLDARAFIEARTYECRLNDYHPTMGGTQVSRPGDDSYPPLETGIYSLLEIQQIEKTDFGIESDHTNKEPGKGSKEWWQKRGQNAANARHNQPGGSRDKQNRIRALWATGQYRSREECANKEAEKLGMSVATARKALRNTPTPKT